MSSRTPFALAFVLASSLATSAWAQSVISAHSGVIHLAEGQVDVDGTAVHQKFGEFGDVKTGQTLAAQDGRAEVLLTPGVFLRVAENSAFKMLSNKLSDTRIEALSGTLMVQVDELLQDNVISLRYHDASVNLTKKGIYRIDASGQGSLRVYDGEATVARGSQSPVTAKKGREVELGGEQLEAKNFDTKDTDAFYRWNERRDEYISEANVSAARSASTLGSMGYAANGSTYGTPAGGYGTWAFNPWFGMFTYVPYDGMFYSPFGYGYYSPMAVGYLYGPSSPYLLRSGTSAVSNLGTTRNTPFLNSSSARPALASNGVFGSGVRGGAGPSSGSETAPLRGSGNTGLGSSSGLGSSGASSAGVGHGGASGRR